MGDTHSVLPLVEGTISSPKSLFNHMKKGLFLFFVLFACFSGRAQLTYDQLQVVYDSAIEYKNLKIIPVILRVPGNSGSGGPMSLSKALEQGLVSISERGTASTENVHWLRINNRSKRPLYVASGEVIMGGRQDRMVARDTILYPNGGRDQYVGVMCVEEDRWSDKEKKFTYFNYANPRLRKVLDHSKNQVSLWREIYNQLDSSGIKSPTLSYTGQRLDKKAIADMEGYLRFFTQAIGKRDSTWAGFICVSGDQVIGADIYNSQQLFYDQLVPLLQGYIEEAVLNGSIVHIKDEKVKTYIDPALNDEKSQENYLKERGKIFRNNNEVFHITIFGE